MRNLTIDHQKPQGGGQNEAVLRSFRAAGLTNPTGVGVKNEYLHQQFAAQVGGNAALAPQRGMDADRYTLILAGIVYSSLLAQNGQIAALKDMAMRPCGELTANVRAV